jgi:hypothetical protein
MIYCNDFSHYTAENILHAAPKPAHSGPELCQSMPKSKFADKLAREIVLDKISLVSLERPLCASGGGGVVKGLKLHLS